MICRTGRGAEKGATGSSYNRRGRGMGGRTYTKQKEGQRQRQVFSMLERIYGGVRYLGRKGEFRERERSGRRIREEILARHGRCGTARMRGNDIQAGGVTREVHSEDVVQMVRQAV